MSDRLYIFDTTLRDGEQSPGCSMRVPEKLRMARKLVELGVDILEAEFPIASEGEYEAVTAVSKEFPRAQVAAPARCCTYPFARALATPCSPPVCRQKSIPLGKQWVTRSPRDDHRSV